MARVKKMKKARRKNTITTTITTTIIRRIRTKKAKVVKMGRRKNINIISTTKRKRNLSKSLPKSNRWYDRTLRV